MATSGLVSSSSPGPPEQQKKKKKEINPREKTVRFPQRESNRKWFSLRNVKEIRGAIPRVDQDRERLSMLHWSLNEKEGKNVNNRGFTGQQLANHRRNLATPS